MKPYNFSFGLFLYGIAPGIKSKIMSSKKGFTVDGQFYPMGEDGVPYIDQLREQLTEIRHNALQKRGYLIEVDPTRITCFTCNRTSYNFNDVENRYCGCCNKFH